MKRIILFILLSCLLCHGALYGQTITVTGTVTSSVEGEGTLPGVAVVAKGTTTGTATDAFG